MRPKSVKTLWIIIIHQDKRGGKMDQGCLAVLVVRLTFLQVFIFGTCHGKRKKLLFFCACLSGYLSAYLWDFLLLSA